MSINPTTSDPYAYLDRALPNSPVAQYVPGAATVPSEEAEAFGEDGFGFDDFSILLTRYNISRECPPYIGKSPATR